MQKKSQGGMNAAILVAIIAGLIILYIIFLPTSEREKVMEQRTTKPSVEEQSNVLLRVSPGTLSASKELEDEKSIPNVFLVETTNAKELDRINPFIVRNGVFDKKIRKVDFALEEPDNTGNVVLTFTAKKRKGILSIKLNGVAIFENELTSDIIEPVNLDKKLLQNTNSLEFSVSPVGFKFWTTNEYSLENIKIVGDITDTSRQESSNIFALSDSEFSSLDRAVLKFIPYCGNVNDLGTLDIFVNNKKILSSVPTCDRAYSQSIPKSALNEDENNIVFKTSKGSYSIEQIRIGLEFKEPTVKTYTFEIDSKTFKQVRDDEKDVTLTIKFADDKKLKMANLDINGHTETIETEKATFSKDIDTKAVEGNNFVRLEPLEDLEIVELKIELT